jgi:hypothetical protein
MAFPLAPDINLQARVDGVVGHLPAAGSYSTITGSGFGTKDSTTPYFDDFEAETVGTINSTVGNITFKTPDYTEVINTDKNSGSKCLQTDFGQSGSFPEGYIPLSGTKRNGYFACALKFEGITLSSQAVWKHVRIGAGTIYHGYPHAGFSHTGNSSDIPLSTGSEIVDGDGTLQGWGSISGHNTASPPNDGDVSGIYQSGVFQFYEVEWDAGTVDGNDSFFVCRVNGVEDTKWENLPFLTSGNPALPTWMITPMNGMGTLQPIIYKMDDLYQDETRNRVVMTDNAVYASSSKWAVQPIVSWSDTSISITKKRQNFAVDDTAYLHVFNAAGTLVHTTDAITVEAD